MTFSNYVKNCFYCNASIEYILSLRIITKCKVKEQSILYRTTSGLNWHSMMALNNRWIEIEMTFLFLENAPILVIFCSEPSIAMTSGDLITTSLFTMFKENFMFCVFVFAVATLVFPFELQLWKKQVIDICWKHIESERWWLSSHKLFTKNEAFLFFFYENPNIFSISVFLFLFYLVCWFYSLLFFLLFGVRFSLRLDIYRNHIGLRSVVNVFR